LGSGRGTPFGSLTLNMPELRSGTRPAPDSSRARISDCMPASTIVTTFSTLGSGSLG